MPRHVFAWGVALGFLALALGLVGVVSFVGWSQDAQFVCGPDNCVPDDRAWIEARACYWIPPLTAAVASLGLMVVGRLASRSEP